MTEIIENNDRYVVCIKPHGIESEEKGMVSALRKQLSSEIYPVHRLDKAASGLMVFAKTKEAAAFLSEDIRADRMRKEYLTVCAIRDIPDEGVFSDLMFHDRASNKSFIVKRMRKGVKECELSYRVLARKDGLMLVRVSLGTGRTHQIRTQFASRKMPIAGDRRYGSLFFCDLALFSCLLEFRDPATGERKRYEAAPNGYPFDRFNRAE